MAQIGHVVHGNPGDYRYVGAYDVGGVVPPTETYLNNSNIYRIHREGSEPDGGR